MINYELSLIMAVSAIVWIHVLIDSDGIFSFMPKWFDVIIGPGKLKYMLFECAKCNSAWWMIGFIIIYRWLFTFQDALFQVIMTIFFAYIIDLTIGWIKRQ